MLTAIILVLIINLALTGIVAVEYLDAGPPHSGFLRGSKRLRAISLLLMPIIGLPYALMLFIVWAGSMIVLCAFGICYGFRQAIRELSGDHDRS